MIKCQGWAAAVLAASIAACGGSGSTGLVSPEGALLHEVRRDGTCVTSAEMVTYCATGSPDAVSPGGASAAGPLNDGGSAPTSTPGGPFATPSPGAVGSPTAGTSPSAGTSPTPAATAVPSTQPTPCQSNGGPCPLPVALQFTVRGLPDGAVCGLAARPADSTGPWSRGTFVDAGGAVRTIEPSLPADVGPGLVEIALLCFDEAPTTTSLPPTLEELADAEPDVVFAPADRVTVPAAPAP